MKLAASAKTTGFNLSSMMIAMAIGSMILAVTLTSSIALQKSFNQIDNYSATHMQQVRIIDYLARDVRRGLSVISSVDLQTVTISVPKYIYQANDPDLPSASKIGTPRPPRRDYVSGSSSQTDPNINYGNQTVGTANYVGVSTVIYCISNSAGTDCNPSGGTPGKSILRKQDGVITTIAFSTDNIVPSTTDIELANTEYTTTAVTFQPISVADRNGTVVYSTAYLRNRRRPPP
jgi:Tfp pilus assembly protein PilW